MKPVTTHYSAEICTEYLSERSGWRATVKFPGCAPIIRQHQHRDRAYVEAVRDALHDTDGTMHLDGVLRKAPESTGAVAPVRAELREAIGRSINGLHKAREVAARADSDELDTALAEELAKIAQDFATLAAFLGDVENRREVLDRIELG